MLNASDVFVVMLDIHIPLHFKKNIFPGETSSNETTITVAVVVSLVVMLVISVAVCITWRKWKHRADGSTEDTTELQLLNNDNQAVFKDLDPRLCGSTLSDNPEVTEKCCLAKEKQIEIKPTAEKK